ncbi:MAG: sigma-54 dependent transcriptional regulator [Desulfobulbaceae bacterium]|nr:sigma-54 dependent transcriptional regulator [Desulfobulbaceae bacterium]
MKILIVDDEDMQRETLQGFLDKKGYSTLTAANGREGLELFNTYPIQLVLLDHKMPDMNGDEVLARMKEINPLIHAIMITAYGAVGTAVKVMQLGADDFLEKPVDLVELLAKIEAIEQQVAEEEDVAAVNETIDRKEMPLQVIGESPAMRKLLSVVQRVAQTPWTALIRGETGTGKELIARLIHLLSPRSQAPFIEVNCAAIPENLFESELFGHEKGSFTGATGRRKGRFELAQTGSLFLDEVGELPLSLQAKLLRALQEKKISRVGSEEDIEVDVRVLAATNRDLKQQVTDGHFREDLYYRLNVLEIEIPPLRNRKEDIPLLVDFFLERYTQHPIRFDPEAMATLIKFPFPGNVRELEHIIQRLVTMARGTVIKPADLPAEMRFHKATEQGTLADQLESMEREMIITALEKHDWVQTRAAESLGISERVLRYKMGKHSIKK